MTVTPKIFGTLRICSFCLLGSLLLTSQQATGQVSGYHAGATPMTPAMKYFGRGLRASVAQPQASHQVRRQAPIVRRAYQPVENNKPFQNVRQRSTISPYLALDALENNVGLPNYYLSVLPQLQQQEANDAKAIELRRLQQQVRTANAANQQGFNSPNGAVRPASYSSQFLNNGSYFPTLRR